MSGGNQLATRATNQLDLDEILKILQNDMI